MLPVNLTTNEVKDSAGTEQEFYRLSSEGRTVEFARVGEAPNLPHRIKVSHQEVGKDVDMRRRSAMRTVKTVAGVDGKPVSILFYTVADIPIGNIASLAEAKNVCAEHISLLATTGAGTTVLFDGTGYGSDSLINGSL